MPGRPSQFARAVFEAATWPLPASWHARLHVRAKLGYWPRLHDPRTFTERLQTKKLYDRDPLIATTADKYLLRNYVDERLGRGFVPELYAVVQHPEEIDVAALPRRYAMKATHASGWNRIVEDGELGLSEARELAARWLGRSFYRKRREWAYRHLVPRVLFEENLALDGVSPDDYKVFTFSGRPHMIQVDHDRFGRHARSFFSTDWTRLEVLCDYPRMASEPPRPPRLNEMLQIASELSEPFGFARVDLYALRERTIVGEITHYPDGGVVRFTPPEVDLELGEAWNRGVTTRGGRLER